VTGPWLLRRLVHDAGRHRVVWFALAGAFAVLGFCATNVRLAVRARRASSAAAARPAARIIAYVNDDLDAQAVTELQRVLRELPGVEEARLASAREVIELLHRELGDQAAVLDGVDEDLLFRSLDIAVRPASAAALAFRLRRLRGIADVDLVDDGELPGQSSRALSIPAQASAHEGARASVALAAAAWLALWAAIALLRRRVRGEMPVFLAMGLTRGDSLRAPVLLTLGAATLGAVAGTLAAVSGWRAWVGAAGLPVRDWAVGLAALIGVALLLALAVLRVPDTADAR
jgi:FtsX extracellular domain